MMETHNPAAATLIRMCRTKTARIVVLGSGHQDDDTLAVFTGEGFATASLGPADGNGDAALDAADVVIVRPQIAQTKTRTPDASPLIQACEHVARHPGRVRCVMLESTAAVGTTRGLLAPVFERAGFRFGEDLFLAVAPTRVAPADSPWRVRNTPRVLAGMTADCLAVASALYGAAVDTVVPVSSVETAEMVKTLETEFRVVNVAMANELAKACHAIGVSTREVIGAAATKPFGFMAFEPGPGLAAGGAGTGGLELTWKHRSLGLDDKLFRAADEINRTMPGWVVSRAIDILNDDSRPVAGATILVAGVAYKSDVGVVQDSPAVEIIGELLRLGARVTYVDPHVPELVVGGTRLQSASGGGEGHDLVIILTDHKSLELQSLAASARVVFDLRNAAQRLRLPDGVRVVPL
ncbi:MAG: nucleotide sugar dehydrogenase [Vicinamibacterales bacterium]